MMDANGRDEIGVKLPGGAGGYLKGFNLIMIVLLLGGLALALYVIHLDATADATSHAAIAQNQDRLVNAITVQNWLLSLPAERRPPLPPPCPALRAIYGTMAIPGECRPPWEPR
jgi:hypothetical protein